MTGRETFRTREGVMGERAIWRCLSASASRKKVAAVLPYASVFSSLSEKMSKIKPKKRVSCTSCIQAYT